MGPIFGHYQQQLLLADAKRLRLLREGMEMALGFISAFTLVFNGYLTWRPIVTYSEIYQLNGCSTKFSTRCNLSVSLNEITSHIVSMQCLVGKEL